MTDIGDEQQTLGQYRVGAAFNPSASKLVDEIKAAAADLIDLCDEQSKNLRAEPGGGEIMRLWVLAMTDFETGAMHAVKAATKVPR